MKRQFFLLFLLCVGFARVEGLSYINGKDISIRSLLIGCYVAKLEYAMLDAGDEDHSIGSKQRYFGIHNMQVRVTGCEPIDLIKDDACHYPHLFTILGTITPECLKYNWITQRWACVKYWFSLFFGFKLKDNELKITSALSKYRVLAPCMSSETFQLNVLDKSIHPKDRKIEVVVNGKVVGVPDQVLEVNHNIFADFENLKTAAEVMSAISSAVSFFVTCGLLVR